MTLAAPHFKNAGTSRTSAIVQEHMKASEHHMHEYSMLHTRHILQFDVGFTRLGIPMACKERTVSYLAAPLAPQPDGFLTSVNFAVQLDGQSILHSQAFVKLKKVTEVVA